VTHSLFRRAVLILATFALATPAFAQDDAGDASGDRTRIGFGPNVYPSYPGSDEFDIGPLFEFERSHNGKQFGFEAPDDSAGFSLIDAGGFRLGPVVSWEGSRTAKDVGANLPKVKFSIEPGAFASLDLSDSFRLRVEARKGVTGHKGWIGMAGADYVARDGDDWLFSVGPRVTWSNNRYHDAWFGVSNAAAIASGLPAYNPGSGIQAYGAAASFLTQFGPHWGIYTYAKYDRLVGDAADSPIVRQLGSRDQFSGGLALTYVFDGDIFDLGR
jgi:outer membrane scaffolding protein for murein synthesis (MipA/OmpV family)